MTDFQLVGFSVFVAVILLFMTFMKFSSEDRGHDAFWDTHDASIAHDAGVGD